MNNQEHKSIKEILDEKWISNKKDILELVRIKNIWELISVSKWEEIKWIDNSKILNQTTKNISNYILSQMEEILWKFPEDNKKLSIARITDKIWNKLIDSWNNENEKLWLYIQWIALKIENIYSRYKNIKTKIESLRDPLTWLHNRRYLNSQLDKLVELFPMNENQFSVMLLDIDFFKNINDTFWHDIWDMALKWMAEILNKNLRKKDIISRWWWEEFLIILRSINHKTAMIKAEKLRIKIQNELKTYINSKSELTCSIWVSTYMDTDLKTDNADNLIKRADDALYIAKENWRNKVYSWKRLYIERRKED